MLAIEPPDRSLNDFQHFSSGFLTTVHDDTILGPQTPVQLVWPLHSTFVKDAWNSLYAEPVKVPLRTLLYCPCSNCRWSMSFMIRSLRPRVYVVGFRARVWGVRCRVAVPWSPMPHSTVQLGSGRTLKPLAQSP